MFCSLGRSGSSCTFLPLIVLYEPNTPEGAGSLGDTTFNAVQNPVLGILGFLLAAVPAAIAIAARSNESPSLALPAFLSAASTFFLVVVPIIVVGTLIAFFPFSGLQKLARNVGFRVEVGPGAWAAAAAVTSMMIASARMLGAERLERLHILWLIPRRNLNWRVVGAGIAVLVGLATMRILPWLSAEGTVDLILPYLGRIDRTGDFSVSIGFFPFLGATQFTGVTILAVGLVISVLRSGLVGPLALTLGGWLVMLAAGGVGSITLGEQSIGIGHHEAFGVVITRVDVAVDALTPAAGTSFLLGLATVVAGLATVLRSDRAILGD